MIGYGYKFFPAGWLLITGYWLLTISRATTKYTSDARFVLMSPADERDNILGDEQQHSGQQQSATGISPFGVNRITNW
jgi:hypothetical protein